MDNRADLKETLLKTAQKLQMQHTKIPNAPITDLDIGQESVKLLESLAQSLESVSPYPYPLADEAALALLNGAWLLLYSDAREIRSLSSLPVGLVLGEVYQVIDVANQSFENKAYVHHRFGLITGYVRVTATFEPTTSADEAIRDRVINVFFKRRYVNVQRFLGIKTPLLEPLKSFPARPPEGRIPSLDITYLDPDLRLGRGGDGSLFILSRPTAQGKNIA